VKLTCVACPMGCELTAQIDRGEVVSVTGNACKRGVSYAKEECVRPTRTLTTTVVTRQGILLPVKSARPLPKERMMEFMATIKSTRPEGLIEIGDVVISDIGGTGVDIIATGNQLQCPQHKAKGRC